MFRAFGDLAGLRPRRQELSAPEPDRPPADDGYQPPSFPGVGQQGPPDQPPAGTHHVSDPSRGEVADSRKYEPTRVASQGFSPAGGGFFTGTQNPNDDKGWGWAQWNDRQGNSKTPADPRYWSNFLYRPWGDFAGSGPGSYMPKDPYA